MNRREASIVKLAMKLIALGIVEEDILDQETIVDNLDDLDNRLNILYQQHRLLQAMRITSEALSGFSTQLADAHLAAAEISVDGPTEDQVATFKAALEALHEDIKNDERYRAAFNILLSLEEAIPDLA